MTQPTEEQISADLLLAGEDPNDPLARGLYLEALAATAPRRSHLAKSETLITRVAEASHQSHAVIGEWLGKTRATVQAYGSGRIPEDFNAEQLADMRAELEDQFEALAVVIQDIAKLQGKS